MVQLTQTATLAGAYFQPALSRAAIGNAPLFNDRAGELVTDVEDITQCIDVILSTPKGAQPHRPLFGSNVWRYIDYPINIARPNLVREISIAISAWEPRITLDSVRVFLADVAQLMCQITWRFKGAPNSRSNRTSTIPLTAGAR